MKILNEYLQRDEYFKTITNESLNEALDVIENFITQKISH
jgi:hypothetical protein